VARVQEAAHGLAERLGGEVGGELGADGTVVAVGTADLTPNNAELAAELVSLLHLVDVCELLAEVEGDIILVVQVLKLDDGSVVVGVLLAAGVGDENALNPQPVLV